MIERLKNCPNCAGILDDAGRCKYCGSKVYDFLAIDFSGKKETVSNAQTFIRIRLNDGEYILPILAFIDASITATPHYAHFETCDGMVYSKMLDVERRVDLSCFCGDLMKLGGVKEE